MTNIRAGTRAERTLILLVAEPLHWVAAGLFLNISGITDYSKSLSSVESAVFVAAMLTSVTRLWFSGSDKSGARPVWQPMIAVAGLGLLAASLLSSLLNGQQLSLLDDFGWRHFAKFMLLMTFGLMVYPDGRASKMLHPVTYISLAVLAISVLIRFHLFKEFNADTGRMELSGRHGDPNFACLFMTIGTLYAVHYLAGSDTRRGRIVHACFGLLFLVTAWFTESRAGLAVLATTFAGAVFLLPLGKIKGLILACGSLGGLAAITLAGDRLLTRYLTRADASNSGRVAGILAAQDMLLEQPLWGSGFNSSSAFVQPYLEVLFASNSIALEIHTTPLQIAGELGLTGILAYGFLYFGIIRLLLVRLREKSQRNSSQTRIGLITFAILGNMISIPMTYIGTVHGIALVLLYELLSGKQRD